MLQRTLLFSLLSILCLTTPLLAQSSYSDLLARLGENYANGEDPYKEEYVGKWPGQRYPELLAWEGDYVLFDNFRVGNDETDKQSMRGLWTSALIDLSKLKKVSFVMCRFPLKVGPISYPNGGHGELMYEFERGGVKTPHGEIGGFDTPFGAFRRDDQNFDPVKGMGRVYKSIFTFYARNARMSQVSKIYDAIEFFELDLSKEQMKTLLINTLKEAFEKERLQSEYYNTVRNSCLTNQIRLLNQVVPKKQRIRERFSLSGILPKYLADSLRDKGLVRRERQLSCPDGVTDYINQNYSEDVVVTKRGSNFRNFYHEDF